MHTRRQFMTAALAFAACARAAAQAQAQARDAAPALRAGAGRADVVFPAALFPIEGFAVQHDPLAARVLLLDSGGMRIAIAVVDITSMSETMVAAMKAILARVAAVPPEQALVCASHTFSAPHVAPPGAELPAAEAARNAAVAGCYETALLEAATQAVGAMQPATLGAGPGLSRVGVNRDVPTPGGWWLGQNDAGVTDPVIGVVRVDGRDGVPLAVLLNAAVQPSIMDGSERIQGGRQITGDLAGAAARHVERHYGDKAVALFLIGAAGDQAPLVQANRHVVRPDGGVARVDVHDAGLVLVDLLGEKLGSAAVRTAEDIRTVDAPLLALRRGRVEVDGHMFSPRRPPTGPVTRFDYQLAGKASVPFVLLRVGDLAIVGVQPELSASLGVRIRTASPYPHTMVATMVDGAAKYLPDRQAYERFTYEARSSPFAPGAADQVCRAIIDGLKWLAGQP